MQISSLTKRLSLTVVAATLLALGLGGTAQASSLIGSYGGSKYYLTDMKSWTDAQTEAISLGGNLATLNNAAEENWLKSVIGTSNLFWIGFTDQDVEGAFKWISGQSVTYTNWLPGEPNDFFGEDYTVINWGSGWNDLPDSSYGQFQGIAEVSATAVPTPALLPGLIGLGLGVWRRRKGEAEPVS